MSKIDDLRKRREKLSLEQEKIRLQRRELSAQIRALEYADLEKQALAKLASKSGNHGVRLHVQPATLGAIPTITE